MNRSSAPSKKRVNDIESVDSPASKRKPPVPSDVTYQLDEKILCQYNGQFYEAKIIRLTQEKGRSGYEIHYQGWNKRYDEFVSEEEAKTRFKKYDENELKKAITKQKEARKSVASAVKPSDKATPTVKKQISKTPVTIKTDSLSVFDDLVTEDLAFVLCEENEYITKRQKTPNVPASTSVQQILSQFLISKGLSTESNFGQTLEDTENIIPQKMDSASAVACIINIFDCAFTKMLVYNEEKEFFDNFLKEEKGERPVIKRYSRVLGFTHFLRFLSRLSDILKKNSYWKEDTLKLLAETFTELSVYLNRNIDTFYSEDYYKVVNM